MKSVMKRKSWWDLRSAGQVRVLKVSYLTILATPMLARQDGLRRWLNLPDYVLALTFISSCSLLVATIVYDVGCPSVIKRYAAPIDFFEAVISVGRLAKEVGVTDFETLSYKRAVDDYEVQASRSPRLRSICAVS